jgi:hypothetical protein
LVVVEVEEEEEGENDADNEPSRASLKPDISMAPNKKGIRWRINVKISR